MDRVGCRVLSPPLYVFHKLSQHAHTDHKGKGDDGCRWSDCVQGRRELENCENQIEDVDDPLKLDQEGDWQEGETIILSSGSYILYLVVLM
jgi:hypothetical protein